MEKISRFSVNQPVTVMMFVFAIILLGTISFQRLGIEILPDLNNPSLFIELEAGERPPGEIENLFVEQLESLASRQRGVSDVTSKIKTGSALITVQYGWNTDMDEAFLDLQKTVTDLGQQIDVDNLSISQYDPNAQPVMTLALSHPEIDDMNDLRLIAENYIQNELIRIDGIAEVKISGEEEKEVVIETDRYLLDAFGITTSDISNKIQSFNQNISGGSVVEMGLKYVIKGVSIFESIDDIKNLIITYKEPRSDQAADDQQQSESTPVYLRDVANVTERNKDPENIVHLNGRRCVGLGIYKETKFNTVEAAELLSERLVGIRKALPGYTLDVVDNQADYVNSAINEVKQSAVIGIFLAVLVLFVFLRRLGATAIISASIPISIIATFTLMYFKGLTLNIMTLGGLALGAGMLVDNSIVVVESIVRNIESGMGIKESAVRGTAQVSGAITAATITTIIVFLPIVYIHGVAGELFKDQALTVAFSLISSLVVAILVIPMLSVKTLKAKPAAAVNPEERFKKYGEFLARILKKRWTVIGCAVLLVASAALLIPVVGSEFIPDTKSNEFSINLTLPSGTELERTAGTIKRIEDLVKSLLGDEIDMIYSVAGPINQITSQATTIFQDENSATIKVILKEKHKTDNRILIDKLSGALSGTPGLEVQFVEDQSSLQSILGTQSAPVVIEVTGDNLDRLKTITEEIKLKLLTQNDLFNIETTFEGGRPEIEIHIDRLRAGLYGIGIDDITSQLQNRLMGQSAGSWDKDSDKEDITIRFPEAAAGDLKNFYITKGGSSTLLFDIASASKGYAPEEINRRNQKRAGMVSAYYKEGKPFNRVIGNIEKNLSSVELPPDYGIELLGEEQKRRDSFGNLKFALLLSIVLVYMVLASQFESLAQPFTILLTIPLAGVGAVLIFLATGKPLSIMAYIGIIMLAGIAVNDSIILVDTINRIKRAGSAKEKAIINAARQRARPIIMTSVTTILALLPLTLGFGEGAALRAPMALAVIGGLVTSTILTLVVIPCVYYVLDRSE